MSISPEIMVTDSLRAETRNIIELAKPYQTVILLFSDDFSGRVLASWAELDRLNLQTHRIGQIYSGIEVHSFGLDPFPDGTRLELHIRETARDSSSPDPRKTAYRSLLNELTTITVNIPHLQQTEFYLDALS